MLRNRVDPFGNLIITKERGQWLGNRGQLHNTGKTILRPFKHKAWIICELEFKNRHREIMAPNLWTELFFLDEATALGAGHRPCFECRREAAVRFKKAWLGGNPEYQFDIKTSIGKIDEIIHTERIANNGSKVNWETSLKDLPDGAFISIDEKAYLLKDGVIREWSPGGYLKPKLDFTDEIVNVLTPKSIVNALKNGYEPKW